MWNSVVVVGSGPSGVSAALGFLQNGIRPVVVDVGFEAQHLPRLSQNFYEYRKADDAFHLMVGEKYEGLQNILSGTSLSPKLTSPYMEFVIRDTHRLSPIDENGFTSTQSFSCGGLANAWGAGLYRCLDDELANMPLKKKDLEPYYDRLTDEIGISGDEDDLTPFFGSTSKLLKPMRLSLKSERMYLNYQKRKNELNERGVFVGRPRLGVLSEEYDGRTAYDYSNLDCWFPNLPYIYTPSFTLKKLIREERVEYHKGLLVKSWERRKQDIVLHCMNTNDDTFTSFACKILVLAAGTINTSKIVLSSKRDFRTRLTLIDNPLLQIPLIFPSFIGGPIEKQAFGLTNLNLIYERKKEALRLQGSIIELTSPARALFLEMLPFSFRDNLALLRFITSGILALFLFFPSSRENEGHLNLKPDGGLEIKSPPYAIDRRIVKKLVGPLWKMGALTHPLLFRYASPGYAIHYAGTLPMVRNPLLEYQCNEEGELHGEPGVYIADGSLFSSLPAKNLSFTIMANSMRIADKISKRIADR